MSKDSLIKQISLSYENQKANAEMIDDELYLSCKEAEKNKRVADRVKKEKKSGLLKKIQGLESINI